MNDENLKGHGFHERSAEEVRELQAKGGRNSGKTRRRKADLRKAVQAALTGTYTDDKGEKLTGEEIFIKSLMEILNEPSSKNWGKAADTIIKLSGADVTPTQIKKDKAEIELLKAKIAAINSGGAGIDVEDLALLAEMLKIEQDPNN